MQPKEVAWLTMGPPDAAQRRALDQAYLCVAHCGCVVAFRAVYHDGVVGFRPCCRGPSGVFRQTLTGGVGGSRHVFLGRIRQKLE
jgi:hypothetical protein